MLRVGLTGGIGAGKSTVATRLAEHGAVIIDADLIAREVVQPGTEGLAELVAEFGEDIRTVDGALDRPKLAAAVFADDAARARLNAIVHPKIGVRTGELMAAAPADAVLVHDVPLLVENDLAPAYHLVVNVHADADLRVRRLVSSRDMTEQEAHRRIAAQATDEQRRAVADVWLDNGATEDAAQRTVDALWADRLVPFEANLRLERPVRLPAARLVPADDRWPVAAARLCRRVTAAVGGDHPVQHIGSTAVPGLDAKNVIDLQLLVPDLDTADALADALAAAGFPRFPEQWQDWQDGAGAAKRLHGSADPARPVHLHVRPADGTAAREALLFRDWLRAEADPRAEYRDLKAGLADGRRATADYAVAKEPWFAAALPRARAWAERTGWTQPRA